MLCMHSAAAAAGWGAVVAAAQRRTVVKFCSDFLDDLKVLECAQSFFMPHHRRVIGHSPCQEIERVNKPSC